MLRKVSVRNLATNRAKRNGKTTGEKMKIIKPTQENLLFGPRTKALNPIMYVPSK